MTHFQVVSERMNRLPLGIFILFLSVIGIVGNAFVLNIFRKIQYDSIRTKSLSLFWRISILAPLLRMS